MVARLKRKSRGLLLIVQFFAFLPLSIFADQQTVPPFDRQSLVGTWEALVFPPPLDELFHMQINAAGDSYLVEGDSVRRLLSAEVKNGSVRLHFGKPFYGQSAKPDCWIVGRADPVTIVGQLILCEDCSPPEFPWSSINLPIVTEITLAKGPWTRAVGDASRVAEEKIRDVTGADPSTGIEGVITFSRVSDGPSGTEATGPVGSSTFAVQKGKQTIASFTTDKQGQFRVWLKPDHYTVSAIGDKGGANSWGSFEADVVAGQMTKVKWCCNIKTR